MTRLIDADALITAVLKKAFDDVFLNGNTDMHRLLIQVIAHQPTIDAEPVKHGKWEIEISDYGHQATYLCSECGHRFKWVYDQHFQPVFNYCQKCGADMRGEQDG